MQNARLPLEIFDLDQTDGNRDDLSLNTMAQEADKKCACLFGVSFIIFYVELCHDFI